MIPPRFATWLLDHFGHPDTLEEVQGDLLELYTYWVETVGVRKANWRYSLSVLKLLQLLTKRNSSEQYPLFLAYYLTQHIKSPFEISPKEPS
ncbi:hypothetical protein GO755_14475 [Spirosoma sp. HMF4905]|uniref:Uncharacterized protein n=1 Tax=Spirosoma arboris TaxID=2682092 RepID=A0A7K1SBU7_9BACT|nr:permease prefix domain 2-containing transporter [Spirosoma arboris]MVM31245.1 hypothetical protein [Spirosoma arboris]